MTDQTRQEKWIAIEQTAKQFQKQIGIGFPVIPIAFLRLYWDAMTDPTPEANKTDRYRELEKHNLALRLELAELKREVQALRNRLKIHIVKNQAYK